MTNSIPNKYLVFVGILVVGLVADQWTKWYASQRLATYRPGLIEHPIELTVPDDAESSSVRDFLETEFQANSADELDKIARTQVRTPEGDALEPSDKLEAGESVVVDNRKVTVIDGYWDFEYTVNPGAAFGLLSDNDSGYRLPFFIVVSLLAIAIILYLLRGVADRQRILIVSLSMIGTGALGNFIDRIRFGHVIDFIVWKYTDQYRWPTFNIADALISVGVALMLIEIFRGEELDEASTVSAEGNGEVTPVAPSETESPPEEEAERNESQET